MRCFQINWLWTDFLMFLHVIVVSFQRFNDHSMPGKFTFWRKKQSNIWVLFTFLIQLSQLCITALDFSAESNEKYVQSAHFCFLPFEIMSFWYTHSEIWKISALSMSNLNISSFLMAPNPSLLEHQVIVLQTYVFSLASAERGKLDLWWTKYCWELNLHQKLV